MSHDDLDDRFDIHVYRAGLPVAACLLPYLETVDATHWYSNGGALARELERRLVALLGGATGVALASSGTAALEGAILATAGTASASRPLALVPAYSFVASAIAAQRCGYAPYLLDVDSASWSLDAEALVRHPQLARAGVLVVVAPYGRAPDQRPWRRFEEATGVKVVIDGAAAIEALVAEPARALGEIPVAVSLQATKPLSTAEGGAIVWANAGGLAVARRALTFGFGDARECLGPGSNGKLSEYHAAVGLASMDGWGAYVGRAARVAATFRSAGDTHGLGDALVLAPTVASTHAMFRADSRSTADRVVDALAARRIEARLWYGTGIHRHVYFRDLPADPLPVTDALAPRLIGLPCFDALADAQIETIVATIAEAIRRS